MTNTTDIMATAPNQAASSSRRTSQSTQPKYKAAARQDRKNFGATLDKANAKLDDVKQGVQDLQDTDRKPAQVEEDATPNEQTKAQGKSDTPQDAPQKDENLSAGEKISTLPADKPKDIKPTPKEEIQTADIFFSAEENLDVQPKIETAPAIEELPKDAPKVLSTRTFPLRNLLWQKIFTVPATQAEEKISDANTSADKIETQSTFQPATNQAYFLAASADLLAATNPVETFATAETPRVDAVQKVQSAQNLMSLVPQADNNAQAMLNLLGGRSWRIIEAPPAQTQSADIQPTVQLQNQLADVQPTVQLQTQSAEIQPTVQLQTQSADVQPTVQLQTQLADVQPQAQPQNQPADVQPTVQPQNQPADVQPTVQPQTQSANVQPQVQLQTQSADVQPQVQLQTQSAEIQPQVQIQTQSAEIQPQVQPQTQPVDVQPQVQIQNQSADVQPTVQATIQAAQPAVQQKIDAQPAQIFSDLLGVNVQIEEQSIPAPVTAPQSTPQQFEQQTPQRDAQNFHRQQNFAVPTETQAQPVSTGGEIFAAPLATNNTPQTQQTPSAQNIDAPQPAPQEDFDVPAQIVRQARLIRTATNTEMVIKLNPEHLGELTLRVSVSSSGAVNASFHSDNAQVRTIIENSLVQLRQELNNAGLKVDNVEVSANLNDGGLMNGQGGQAWQQNRQQRQGNRRIAVDALEREIDFSTPANENSATEGVDYSV